jgi:hypothetical protein
LLSGVFVRHLEQPRCPGLAATTGRIRQDPQECTSVEKIHHFPPQKAFASSAGSGQVPAIRKFEFSRHGAKWRSPCGVPLPPALIITKPDFSLYFSSPNNQDCWYFTQAAKRSMLGSQGGSAKIVKRPLRNMENLLDRAEPLLPQRTGGARQLEEFSAAVQ